MFERKNKAGWKVAAPITATIMAALSLTAYASQGLIEDKRITLEQAQQLAKPRPPGAFPVVVNEDVVKWLNYYVGTPDGRENVQQALGRMESHRGVIEKKMIEYEAPQELLAVPFIEAGYRNLGGKQNPYGAAGLWQLMASTAKAYGLRVDAEVDQRLDVSLCTEAALRGLQANQQAFKDWQLSALAYNAGDGVIKAAMTRLGTRDPWILVNSGRLPKETAEYLPRLMAAILIIQNPSLL